MARPENELSLGTNEKISEESSTTPGISNKITSERTPSQPETPIYQEIPHKSESVSLPEVQSFKEEEVAQPLQNSQETIKYWLQRQIKEAEKGGILTKEEKEKVILASTLWAINGIISTVVGGPILASSTFLWRTQDNPLFLISNFIPGALRLGTIIASEKFTGVKFSRLSKVLTFWPTFPGGWAMPYEIASTLGKRRLLFFQIKERYFTSPLSDLNKAFEDFRSVLRR